MKTLRIALASACIAMFASQAIAANNNKSTFAPAASSANGVSLNESNMAGFLRSAGYESTRDAATLYLLPARIPGSNYNIEVAVSPSGKRVHLQAELGAIADLSQLPANLARELLIDNFANGPAYFGIDKCNDCQAASRYRIYISMTMDNRALTPEIFQDRLEFFMSTAAARRDTWDPANWKVARR